MSLFKVCNWWTVQSSDISPSYDSYSLHCCRLGLEENDRDYVVVGSHSGSLCIYKPVYSQEEDEPLSFAPSDVILEIQLGDPIIGLTSGKFSSVAKNDNASFLAILHPMKLVICTVVTTMGIADTGDYSRLQMVQEYHLRSPAFCVCKGYFGGAKGREFLCVNHLDGHLKFFEQEGITFECQLPDERTIPAPFLYVPRVDCFVTVSPAWDLECFRYQDLIDADQLKKKIVPIWSLCIGEGVVDLNVHQVANAESEIVLLGDNNLICISDTGKVKFIKRLDYTPITLCSFVIGWYWEPNARLMIIVASENGSLLIYERSQLVWAAQLSSVPVAIQRANIVGLPGAMVTLSPKGSVNVGYLGSDPHLFKAPPLDLKQLDFAQAHSELMDLEKEIQQGVNVGDAAISNAAAERDLKVQINLGAPEKCTFSTSASHIDDGPKMIRVSVGIRTAAALEQLQVCLHAPPPLKVSQERQMFCDMKSEQSERFDSYVYVERSVDVPNLCAKLVVSFITKDTLVRVLERNIELPLALVCKPTHHQKDAKYRVTLMTAEKDTLDLSKLFPEFFLDSASQALGLRSLYSGAATTVAVSRSSSRFRVQSEHIEAISFELLYLLAQLKQQGAVKLIVAPPNLPIDPLLDLIKDHQSLRDNFNYILVEMDRRNAELRLFELRFNVKSQEPDAKVQGIQYLIDLTHSKLNALDKRLKGVQEEISTSQVRLSCIMSVIKAMVKHLGIPRKLSDLVAAAMCPAINNFLEQSWEELMLPALDYILDTSTLQQHQQQEQNEEIDYLTLTRHEFHFDKFLKQLQEVLISVMQLAIKSGGNASVDDDFGGNDSTDMIEEEKNEWVSNELPAGAAVLIAPKVIDPTEALDENLASPKEDEEEEEKGDNESEKEKEVVDDDIAEDEGDDEESFGL